MRATLLAVLLLMPLASAGADEWRIADVVAQRRFEAFDAASLNLFDFDADGWPEIVSSNDNGRVYVVSLHSGGVLAEIHTTHPDGWNARDINPVSVGDLYGDGVPCLVIPNSAAYLSAWCYDGRSLMGGMDFEKRWEIRVDAAQWDPNFHKDRPWLGDQQPSMDGNAFLADVDGKPGMEIFVETDGYPGQFSFTHTGEHRWHTSFWDGNAGAIVTDLEKDGKKEAIFASDAGVVTVYDANSGKIRWSFDATKNGATPGSITLAPLAADLDGNGKQDLIFAARGATAGLDGSHATWFALRADGSILWARSYDWMNPLAYTHPAAIDVDGNGRLDIVALDWNTIGHKPGNWEPTSRGASLFALRGADGSPLWHTSVPTYWSNQDVVIVGNEIVVNAPREGRDGLGTYDLRNGKALGWTPLPEGWQATRGPVAARAGERVFLVVPMQKPDPTPERSGLDVGDRLGALAIVEATGAGAPRFDANFLHSDAHPLPAARAALSGVPAACALVVAFVGLAWAWRRQTRAGM